MKTSNNKQRLKTYKIKNHDSGKTYSVKAVNYTDAKTKYNKYVLKDNRHTFEALWYTDPDYDKMMTQTFATEKEAMDFYRKNKGKPTFHGWWVTERYPGSWAIKKELVMDTIAEDAPLLVERIGDYTIKNSNDGSHLKFEVFYKRKKFAIAASVDAAKKAIEKHKSNAQFKDALPLVEKIGDYTIHKNDDDDFLKFAVFYKGEIIAETTTVAVAKKEINSHKNDYANDSLTEDEQLKYQTTFRGEESQEIRLSEGSCYCNYDKTRNTTHVIFMGGQRNQASRDFTIRGKITTVEQLKKEIDKHLKYLSSKDSFTEDAYVYPTNASTTMASSFAKQCVEKFGGKVAAKNGNKYVYVAPDKDTAEKAKTFLETKYSSMLPSVKFIVGDSHSLNTYKIKNTDSGKTYRVKATSYTDAKDKYNKHILKDSWSSYTFKTGRRSDAFKQYLRDRGIYFEASQDREYTHFEVKNVDEAVDRRANEIVRQIKDTITEDGNLVGKMVKYKGMPVKVLRKLTEQEKQKRAYMNNPDAGDYYEVEHTSTALGTDKFIVWEARLSDSITEDADIAQTDIKSTYLPEDANADNIQYLGFNEKRKLSFYGYGDRYFVHYDLEGRTEEVDKETVQKILKKNILGEIDENDLINKEPQSEEIVSDNFDWKKKQERGDK